MRVVQTGHAPGSSTDISNIMHVAAGAAISMIAIEQAMQCTHGGVDESNERKRWWFQLPKKKKNR